MGKDLSMSPQRSPLTRALVTGLTLVFLSLGSLAAQEPAASKKALLGFSASGSDKQRALETQFDGVLTPTTCGPG